VPSLILKWGEELLPSRSKNTYLTNRVRASRLRRRRHEGHEGIRVAESFCVSPIHKEMVSELKAIVILWLGFSRCF
jgi:hypothetical protein